MSKYLCVIGILCVFSVTSNSYARECDSSELELAEYMANQAGEKIVNEYKGGQDVYVALTDCQFNSYMDIYKVAMNLSWNGAMFRMNKYQINGVLTMKSNGSDVKFLQVEANQNVKRLRFFKTLASGVQALGNLNASAP